MARVTGFGLFAFFVAVPLYGQAVGAVVGGVVSDESGARLTGVAITLTNLASGRTQSIVSGEQGEYRAVALPPAVYRLSAHVTGFDPFQQEITLTVGSDATFDVRLTVAGVGETVNVQAAGLSFAVARSQPSSVVTSDQIRALPEIGRNFLVLAQLLPGSGPLNASVSRFLTTKFGGPADMRSGFTTLIDGGDVDDAQWGSPTINVSQESVQEFKVFRYQFDAQYGSALNAVVSVVTKSGTNQFTGGAFYFGRDDALNARNAFAQTNPPFDERRFGGSFGGPLARDRSHVFGTVESDDVETVRIIALSPASRFAARENGTFPASSDDRMGMVRLDHRFSPRHSALVRYAYAWQSVVRSVLFPSSDTNQVDTFSRAHSVVGEEDWIMANHIVNTARLHVFAHTTGGDAHRTDRGVAELRPTVSLGIVNGGDLLAFPRTEVALQDTLYVTRAGHDLRFGVDVGFGINELRSQFFQDGLFRFSTDAAFNPNEPSTWPTSYLVQRPSVSTYRSRQFASFFQDDWRVASRVRLNLGVRYDLDPTLRINDFYERALADPALAGLEQFVSGDRGTDTNNLQPRVGGTFDLRGDGRIVLRGGWGMYVARNRAWFQVRSMNQLGSSALLVEDRNRLRLYPDATAILAGGAAKQLGTVIPDEFVQSYAQNTSAGLSWQANGAASFDIDYIHSAGDRQYGTTDRNLPETGRIGPANPRPVPQFGQVAMLENYSKSSYDALESQLRIRLAPFGRLQASYTLSRTYLDGVDFFLNQRGTQRTPQERGYSPSDQRHNLTIGASTLLPFGVQAAGILKLVSGSPMLVQTGTDYDGDLSQLGDRPAGVPITVGRGTTPDVVRLINDFRASVGQGAVDPALLRLDPYRTLDLRVTKILTLGRTRRLELLLEAFNVTNYVNYVPAVVTRSMASPLFLARNGARDARQLQWGARFSF